MSLLYVRLFPSLENWGKQRSDGGHVFVPVMLANRSWRLMFVFSVFSHGWHNSSLLTYTNYVIDNEVTIVSFHCAKDKHNMIKFTVDR